MAHGRSTKIISMIKRIRTGRLSIKNSLSLCDLVADPAAEGLFAHMYPGVHLPNEEIYLHIRRYMSKFIFAYEDKFPYTKIHFQVYLVICDSGQMAL